MPAQAEISAFTEPTSADAHWLRFGRFVATTTAMVAAVLPSTGCGPEEGGAVDTAVHGVKECTTAVTFTGDTVTVSPKFTGEGVEPKAEYSSVIGRVVFNAHGEGRGRVHGETIVLDAQGLSVTIPLGKHRQTDAVHATISFDSSEKPDANGECDAWNRKPSK